MRKKIIWGIALILALIGLFTLTLQTPEQTTGLSEWLRGLLISIGFHSDPHGIRSDIHIPMFFVVGVVIIMFGKAMHWRTWISVCVGCAIGVIDECLKIFLPTREFEWIDLGKDFAGVLWSALLIYLLSYIRRDKAEG